MFEESAFFDHQTAHYPSLVLITMNEVRRKTFMNSVRLAQLEVSILFLASQVELNLNIKLHRILLYLNTPKHSCNAQISKFCVVKKDNLFVWNLKVFLNNCILKGKHIKGYSELCQTSKMKLSTKLINGLRPLTIFANSYFFICLTWFWVCLS